MEKKQQQEIIDMYGVAPMILEICPLQNNWYNFKENNVYLAFASCRDGVPFFPSLGDLIMEHFESVHYALRIEKYRLFFSYI